MAEEKKGQGSADVMQGKSQSANSGGQYEGEYTKLLQRQKMVWQVTAWILVGILLVLVIVALGQRREANKARETVANSVVTTVKVCEDLAERLATWESSADSNGYDASLEDVGGLEYLKLSSGEGEDAFALYYRNENYEDEAYKTPTDMGLLLSNGEKTVELLVPYDLQGDLARLCPEQVEFGGEKYLLFYGYTGDTVTGAALVHLETLQEYELRSYSDIINDWFTFEPGADEDTVVLKNGNGVSYEYWAEPAVIEMAKTLGAEALLAEEYLTWVPGEDGIDFSAAIYAISGAYYGELKGTMLPKDGELTVEASVYGAYVEPDYDDQNGDKINVPSSVYLEEPVILSAGTKERLYLARYEKVGNHDYDWSGLVEEAGEFRYLKDEDGNVISKLGIDVSKHQGEIDWEQVADAGIEFAFVRVGYRGSREGSLYVDECKDANLQGAIENGIPVGVYFYSQAITVEEAIEEAELVLEAIEGYDITYPIVFDTEYYESEIARGNATSRVDRTAIAKAFCQRIEEAGYQPMVYASTRWSIMNIDRDELADYPFWFAYYGDTVSYRYDFEIWQYSASGTVPGVKGDCDMNLLLGDW